MESKEITICKAVFYPLGRNEKVSLIEKSNLTDREMEIFKMKFVEGEYNQEIADHLMITLDAYNKMQKVLCRKFYTWLNGKAMQFNTSLELLVSGT